MDKTPPPLPGSKTGQQARSYLSEAHKRKFTIMTGILGAAFFFAQFILPFIIFMAMVPAMMFSQKEWMKEAKLEAGAYWNEAVWYIEESFGPSTSTTHNVRLTRLSIGSEEGPITVEEVAMEQPWLLAAKDRLWLVSSSAVGFYRDGTLSLEPETMQLGDISRPFLYENKPAVIERTPVGYGLMVFSDNGWVQERSISWLSKEDSFNIDRDLQITADQGTLHIFLKFGKTLYYRVGFPKNEENNRDSWETVSSVGNRWYATLVAGQPAVFRLLNKDGPSSIIVGTSLRKGMQKRIFTHEKAIVSGMGVFSLGENDEFVLLIQSFPGSLWVAECKEYNIISEMRYGSGFPFPTGMMKMMFVPHIGIIIMPLILALILSALMRKYRVCEFKGETSVVPFASLARRAVAQIIDAAILTAPMIVGGLIMMPVFFDFDKMFSSKGMSGMLSVFALMLVGLFWSLACFLLFSIFEGKKGVTPGKWVVRIRVLGTNLKPCGFGRALVRNLLKFVDGFFNFMIGILVIALSENWQRVGDMAARTIVIDLKDRE